MSLFDWIQLWAAFTAVLFLVFAFLASLVNDRGRRKFAWLALASPLWPLLPLVAVVAVVRWAK